MSQQDPVVPNYWTVIYIFSSSVESVFQKNKTKQKHSFPLSFPIDYFIQFSCDIANFSPRCYLLLLQYVTLLWNFITI